MQSNSTQQTTKISHCGKFAYLLLTNGKAETKIDIEDMEAVLKFKWCLSSTGYAYGSVPTGKRGAKHVLLHRMLLQPPPRMQVDHIDGDRLNNSRANLRMCTNQQNSNNMGPRKGRFKGVCWHKKAGKWVASITVDGKTRHLGLFVDIEDAAKAYDSAALAMHGEFARLNIQGERNGKLEEGI